MSEFSEVMRQWVRARKAINENELSCWPLEMFTDDYIANIEKEVMEWAAEHPEPVYPTWREYLTSIGVIPEAVILQTENDEFNTFWRWDEACALTNKRIPADIAEKLGIEPKKG